MIGLRGGAGPDRSGDAGATVAPPALALFSADGSLLARNAADAALFGPAGAALSDRLVPGPAASEFLGQVSAPGAAAAELVCRTLEGEAVCRVSTLPLPGPAAPFAEAAGPGFAERPMAEFVPAGGVAVPSRLAVCFAPLPPREPEVPVIAVERLARLGHELRSPLNAVLGFAELIRHGRIPAERVAEYATDIVTAAWRLLRLADDLVALGETRSGAQMLRMGEVDLGRVMRRLVRLARPVAEAAGVRLDDAGMPRGADGPIVFGDEGALWSAADNLIQNAIRHGGPGARVRLAFRDPGPAGGVCLEIADDGPGLGREALAEALAPYGRPGGGAARRPGGLGLPIARELVEAHDGTLEIETAPGKGFAARLRFPASRCLNW